MPLSRRWALWARQHPGLILNPGPEPEHDRLGRRLPDTLLSDTALAGQARWFQMTHLTAARHPLEPINGDDQPGTWRAVLRSQGSIRRRSSLTVAADRAQPAFLPHSAPQTARTASSPPRRLRGAVPGRTLRPDPEIYPTRRAERMKVPVIVGNGHSHEHADITPGNAAQRSSAACLLTVAAARSATMTR
jgi:hypothetical protein